MTDAFAKLSTTDLRELIAALRSKRVAPPYSALQLRHLMPANLAQSVAAGLTECAEQGFTTEQIVLMLALLESDRTERPGVDIPIDLVTSGPEGPGIANRDTGVVVREMFAHAEKSVLVVGYAVYQGDRVFQALAERMEELPELEARFFLNVPRPDHDRTPADILISRFAQRFRDGQWPSNCRLPEVYYDPRSIAEDGPVRSSLHAKCVVVDEEQVFVSSANFTEAAQQRNIEVGLSIRSNWLATRLIRHFSLMAEHGLACRAF